MGSKAKIIAIRMIITFLFCLVDQMSAQEKVSISGGIGFPELINTGIKYQVANQAKIGLSIGWFPSVSFGYIGSHRTLSVSGDLFYHFGDLSKFSDLPACYVRIGLNNMWDIQKPAEVQSPGRLSVYGRVGKDLYINKNAGVSMDLGLRLNFKNVKENFMALGVYCFYRF